MDSVGFPGGTVVKNSLNAGDTRDPDSIPGSDQEYPLE